MGGRGRCDLRIKVFRKFHKKNFFWGGGVGMLGWGQGGCERRIEVFVKIQKKKKLGGGVGLVGGRGGWVVGGSGWM